MKNIPQGNRRTPAHRHSLSNTANYRGAAAIISNMSATALRLLREASTHGEQSGIFPQHLNSVKLGQGMPNLPKIYPNLNPAAAMPVDRKQIFHLESFFDHFRLKGESHGHRVPNAKYVFVRMGSGETLLHPTYRHPSIAEGKPTVYAGEAFFDNGRLTWWSNASGNYRPDKDHAQQAALPMERFFPFEDVLRGLHKTPRPSTNNRETATLQRRAGGARAAPTLLPSGLLWVGRR